ncbi:hypothetical protein STSO111631_02145 [Stackebrandtia soli]
MVNWWSDWTRYARTRYAAWRRRATGFGVALRVLVWLSGVAAIIPAIGHQNLRMALMLAAVLPLIAALRPTGPWVALVTTVAVLGWFLTTIAEDTPSFVAALVIAGSLYLHHAAATVSLDWTSDAAISPETRRRWTVRTGTTVAGGAATGLLVAGLTGQSLPLPAGVLLPTGITLALGVIGGIVYLARRPGPAD